MTNQDKWLLALRIVALACIIVFVALIENLINSSGVRAPLLTMAGSAAIIMMLFPMDRTSTMQNVLRDVGTASGTATVMYGGVRWLEDAVQRGPSYDFLVAWYMMTALMILLGIYLFLSMLSLLNWGKIKETATRKIMRR